MFSGGDELLRLLRVLGRPGLSETEGLVEAGDLVLVMPSWLVLSVCLDLIAAFFRETMATVSTSSGGRSLKLYETTS